MVRASAISWSILAFSRVSRYRRALSTATAASAASDSRTARSSCPNRWPAFARSTMMPPMTSTVATNEASFAGPIGRRATRSGATTARTAPRTTMDVDGDSSNPACTTRRSASARSNSELRAAQDVSGRSRGWQATVRRSPFSIRITRPQAHHVAGVQHGPLHLHAVDEGPSRGAEVLDYELPPVPARLGVPPRHGRLRDHDVARRVAAEAELRMLHPHAGRRCAGLPGDECRRGTPLVGWLVDHPGSLAKKEGSGISRGRIDITLYTSPRANGARMRTVTYLTRRSMLKNGTMAFVGGSLLARSGWLEATELPMVRRVTLTHPMLPKAFDGLRIAQVSDLHAGPFMPPERLARVRSLVEGLAPDVGVFTGDQLDRRQVDADLFVQGFAGIDAPLGTFGILGNHDHLAGPRVALAALEAVGITPLVNETATLQRNGETIVLAGVDDLDAIPGWGPNFAVVEGGDATFCLLLCHQPGGWRS